MCFLDLRHNSNPKAPQNEKQKNIKPSSLDRQDKDIATMPQGNKKITKIPATNIIKFWFLLIVSTFSRNTSNQL